MAKIDMHDLHSIKDRLESKSADFESESNDVVNSLTEFSELSSFTGKAADSAKNYAKDAQTPVFEDTASLINDEASLAKYLITDFEATVGEQSASAKIDSEDLTSYIDMIDASVKSTVGYIDDFQTELKKVNDIVSAPIVESSDIESAKTELMTHVRETRRHFQDWRNNNKAKLSDMADRVSNLGKAVKLMGKVAAGGPSAYTSAKTKAIVKKLDKSLSQDLISRAERFVKKASDDKTFFARAESVAGIVAGPFQLKKLQKKGKSGKKAFNYLMKDWRSLKKVMRNSEVKGLQRLEKTMRGSLNSFIKNSAHQMQKKKLLKVGGKAVTVKSLAEWIEKTTKAVKYIVDPFKSGLEYAKEHGEGLSKFSKVGGKAVPYVSTAITLASAGYSAYQGYNNPKSPTYHSVPKSAVHAGVEAIKSVGPLEGATAGAAVGGPAGATIGFIGGAINTAGQALFPEQADKLYDGAEKIVDKGVDFATNIWKGVTSVKMPKLAW